jgi:hypothetical protein
MVNAFNTAMSAKADGIAVSALRRSRPSPASNHRRLNHRWCQCVHYDRGRGNFFNLHLGNAKKIKLSN